VEENTGTGSEKARALHGEAVDAAADTHLTTNLGAAIGDNHNQLTAGDRGPSLMEDHVFREKMTHFDHERIPERVVHPRGSGAHGYFQVYEPLTDLTCAAFLQDPTVTTPVFVRFSTVVGFRGSADTVRDVRGFATKFYTSDGNFDLVGNNMPIFFIQDAMKFPDLVHSIKPEPPNEMPQASAAHDTFWDFVSLMPESTHMVLWVLSDRAIPRSYRMMEGFGVHTLRFVNTEGRSRFVKFHWKPLLGTHSLVWDEAQKLAGADPDFHRRDLWEAIEAGDHPEFELGVQVIEEDQADSFDFDLLDPTKLVPEELVPVRRVGKMTLDRNPANFFAETEQVAFHPGHVVPGIDVTNDPLLQGRLFSYLDTQLIRLGGPNFNEIPINRPLVDVHNNQRDGFMRQTIHQGRVSYEPNSLGGGCPMQAGGDLPALRAFSERMEGVKTRTRSETFADHFSQATLFWNSQSEAEKQHIVDALHFELGKVDHMHVRQRIVDLLANVDRDLAERAAAGIGVTDVTGDLSYLGSVASPKPNDVRGAAAPGVSPALSMDQGGDGHGVKTRKIAILAADGFDEAALRSVRDAIRSGGGTTMVIAKLLGPVRGGGGTTLDVDKSHITTIPAEYDAIYLCGGAAVEQLQEQDEVREFVQQAFKHCKPIAAAGTAVELLGSIEHHELELAGADGAVTSSHGVVTAGSGADMDAFAAAFVEAIGMHRHWSRELVGMVG
jgi:catalase